MGKKKKNHSKNKSKKYSANTPQANENPKAETGELTFNELEVRYTKYYQDFLRLLEEDKLFTIVDENTLLSEEAEKLLLNIRSDLASLKDIVDHPFINNIFCSNAIFIYIKLSILCGNFHLFANNLSSAPAYYIDALCLLAQHHSKLNYKDDILFQCMSKQMFKVLLSSYGANSGTNDAEIMKFRLNLAEVYSLFKKNCGDTIVKAACLYDDLMRVLSQAEIKNNKFLKEKREEFFSCARNIKAQFEKMKLNNAFTTEYQLYEMELNYYMTSIHDFTHPHAILRSKPVKDTYQVYLNDMSLDLSGHYLNHWLFMKKAWIAPAMNLMSEFNHENITLHPELRYGFKGSLNLWFSSNVIALDVFGYWTNELLLWMQNADQLPDSVQKKIVDFIFRLEPEIQFLTSNIEMLVNHAAKYQHEFSEIGTNQQKIKEKIHELQEKINQFRFLLQKQAEEKLQIAEVNSRELIQEENIKLALLAKKLKQRYVRRGEKETDYDEPEEDISPESTIDLEVVACINASLIELQELDAAAFHLADKLKSRSITLLKFLQLRSRLNIPLPSDLHEELLYKVNVMLFEYHQLILLHERHELLSKKKEIRGDELIQQGISASQIELKNISRQINQNIKAMLSLIDEILKTQKQNRKNKIYQLGQGQAAREGLINLTHKEIMELGKKLYIDIGKQKIAAHQEFSEYTKQKDFLDTMQLTFSSLNYLQQKIKPYIIENYSGVVKEMGFFGCQQSNGTQREWSHASFEGLLGLILKLQYDKSGDASCLHESLVYFQKAYEGFSAEKNSDAMQEVSARQMEIENILASVESRVLSL